MDAHALPGDDLERLETIISSGQRGFRAVQFRGTIIRVSAESFAVSGLSKYVRLGDMVALGGEGQESRAEVIRIDADEILVKPLEAGADIGIGTPAFCQGETIIHPHDKWLGRVVDALAEPLDDRGPLYLGDTAQSLQNQPPAPLKRMRIAEPVRTGVHAIDICTPIGRGQRIGIFSGSGVGKSTLLAMFARSPDFDVIVIALVGERGREVREFIEDALGDNISKSVIVIATSDESAMMRRLAPKTAMAIAEYFSGLGQSVLFLMDSATRFAQAARDAAMAGGEPAIARGYTPSVFNELPLLFERAGPGLSGNGSITAIISVLVEGEHHNDPLADAIRGILDGHIVLDRAVADQGRYPAIDLLGSISRLARLAWSQDQARNAAHLKRLISRYEETRDLRLMGGYAPGVDLELDSAIGIVPKIYQALHQTPEEPLDGTVDPFTRLGDFLAENMAENIAENTAGG